ncbi:MAG: LuxR family transcriptional regulator [Rhizobiaceae bacterium]
MIEVQNDEHQRLLRDVTEQPDLYGALVLVRNRLSLKHATYNMAQSVSNQFDYPFVRTTYHAEWMHRYLTQNYVQTDPVYLQGFQRDKPFFWSELSGLTTAQQAFFDDAMAHGISLSGYSVPITDKIGRRGFLSVNGSEEEEQWHDRIAALGDVLNALVVKLHDRALIELQNVQGKPPLSPREIECLSWAARGKEAYAIAEILQISEFTVRDYLKSARQKLDCTTIAHAVYEATRLRLINV